MGERVPASIQIGGKITREEADELINMLDSYCMTSNTTGDKPSIENLGDDFFDAEINYGNIDDIITFCVDKKLHYRYWFGSGYDWSDATTVYSPDDGAIEASGHIDQGLSLTEGVIKHLGSMTAIQHHFDRMRRKLPPLEIVDA